MKEKPKPPKNNIPSVPYVSELRVIQEDQSGKTIELGWGFTAVVKYKTPTGSW